MNYIIWLNLFPSFKTAGLLDQPQPLPRVGKAKRDLYSIAALEIVKSVVCSVVWRVTDDLTLSVIFNHVYDDVLIFFLFKYL